MESFYFPAQRGNTALNDRINAGGVGGRVAHLLRDCGLTVVAESKNMATDVAEGRVVSGICFFDGSNTITVGASDALIERAFCAAESQREDIQQRMYELFGPADIPLKKA
jgi:hypothetical protein